jgi:uncharacterized DUF497 family protein
VAGGPSGVDRETSFAYDTLVLEVHATSALKHGVSAESIHEVFASAFETDSAMIEDDDPPRWIMVGFDHAGRRLEVGVMLRSDGTYLAIHAMRARRSTVSAITRARRGQ